MNNLENNMQEKDNIKYKNYNENNISNTNYLVNKFISFIIGNIKKSFIKVKKYKIYIIVNRKVCINEKIRVKGINVGNREK